MAHAETTRINAGIYSVLAHGRTWEIEKFPDGSWLLFEVVAGQRNYSSDFATKRAAVAATAN